MTKLQKGRVSATAINAALASMIIVASAAPVNGANGTGTLTVTGVFSNGETITIGSRVYTMQTVLTNVAGNVLIGASAAASLDNLKAAVNGSAGGGTTYAAATTAHPDIEATTNSDTTQLFVARVKGVAGNVASTETCANASFGAATLTGGVDGTVGTEKEFRYYGGYLYFTPTASNKATATWVKCAGQFGAL